MTMKASEHVGTLKASLKKAKKNGEEIKRNSESVTRKLGALSK